MRKLEVVMSPALLPYYKVAGKSVVVIDILRATSSMCVAFKNGVEKILPVSSPEECRIFKDFDFVIAAEKDAIKVDGFDLGNSPFDFDNYLLDGKSVAMATTNGTKALKYAQEHGAKNIVIGSFLNLTQVCNWIKSVDEDIILLCAGWKDKVNLEDTLFAGAICDNLQHDLTIDCDSALSAKLLYQANKDNLEDLVRMSSHAKRFQLLHLQTDDIKYCLQIDFAPVLPILKGVYLVNNAK
ncbi:MAG: 2-phosphosulfolactate phosphatase [Bacteroidota bacterium]